MVKCDSIMVGSIQKIRMERGKMYSEVNWLEVGKLAYTKHLIIKNGSAYAPTDAYTSNSGVKIKP